MDHLVNFIPIIRLVYALYKNNVNPYDLIRTFPTFISLFKVFPKFIWGYYYKKIFGRDL